MVREIFISIYLFTFRIVFTFFNLFPQKKKTTFVASFGENVFYTLKEVEKHTSDQIVVLKVPQCKVDFQSHSNRTVLNFTIFNIFHWFKSIYHLATSHKIFIDNYYAFLSVVKFKDNVVCTQLWHAAGAIKKFGLQDPSIEHRSPRAIKRFHKVYQKFNYIVVGSEKMANIYKQSFALSNEQILRTGIPRTDFFYNREKKYETKNFLINKFPLIKNKKIILYAPTYRDNELVVSDLSLDINYLHEELGSEYLLLLRLHPAVKANLSKDLSDFVIDVSRYPKTNELLTVTDILISDYSSIPFEFSLCHKPMIFFAYDLDEYSNTRGFWENYYDLVPGPVAFTTEEIANIILKNKFDLNVVKKFSNIWNLYSKGESSTNLVKAIYFDTVEQTKAKVN